MSQAMHPSQPPPSNPSPPQDALFRSMFEAYPDALLLVDAGGTIVLANPAASRMLGYDNAELTGMLVDELVPDAIRPRHKAYRDNYAHKPHARPMGLQMDLVAKCRDGSQVMVEIALSPLRDHGRAYVVASVRGIQGYPRVQQALQRARFSDCVAQLGQQAVDARDPQQLLRETPVVAAQALHIDTAVVYLLEPNRLEFVIASGVGLVDGLTLGSSQSSRPDTLPGFVLSLGAPQGIEDLRAEARFAVPSAWTAQGLISAWAVPLSDRGQTVGVLVVFSRRPRRFDGDEWRFLQSLANLLATSLQRAQSEAALNHAQRLETVGQLSGGIAHDFNNLLTVIQGHLQVLEDHPAVAGDASVQQMLAAASRASRRGAELTSKLLAFSRRQVLSPTRVDVAALLRSLADMLQRTLDPGIRIELHAPQALYCLADAGQLEAALLNLAINARDAMPAGGTLAFSCRVCEDLPEALLNRPSSAAAATLTYIEIEVADSGLGMTDAVRERAFEPFFTTKAAGRGTGLGLATVYGFVLQSNGAVRLQTAPGAGTTVGLVLPRYATAGRQPRVRVERRAALPRGLKVLLVEDQAEVRSVVRQHLQALGCVVSEFANAEQALASLSAGAGAGHDLLLTDIVLGSGISGTELARQVRGPWPRMAVLLMTGYATELVQGQDVGLAEWLHKPFERGALAQAMVRALALRRSALAAPTSAPAAGG